MAYTPLTLSRNPLATYIKQGTKHTQAHDVSGPAQIPGVRMAGISKLSGFSRRLMAPPRLDRVAAACVAS